MTSQLTNVISSSHTPDREFGIPELLEPRITTCRCVPQGNRLNLVIPIISEKWRSFGGPATARRFFERLSAEFESARIVVTHETESQVDLSDWPEYVIDDGGAALRSIAFLGDRATPLAVSARDFFVATVWNTAIYVKRVIASQRHAFPDAPTRFVYLIQEYEPAGYASSARYVYAKSTYRDGGDIIAVFNSRPVGEYFREIGLQFSEEYMFDSMFHPQLRKLRIDAGSRPKERLILAYGRPSAPRNDFDLVVESLKQWSAKSPAVEEWLLLSAGEPHPDVPLGRTAILRSLGKLSLEDYALHLSRCWVGLSFTFTASTSHSVREMAEFGAWVITNQFEYRTAAQLPPNIISVEDPTPEAVARSIAWCCDQYQLGSVSAIDKIPPVFRVDGEEFPFIQTLANSWLSVDWNGKRMGRG